MTTQTEALTLALEALKSVLTDPDGNVCWQGSYADRDIIGDALDEFEKFLAQPKQELVCVCGAVWEGQELVSTPPQRTWVGLTNDDVRQCSQDVVAGGKENCVDRFAYAIEAKLEEKNT